MIDYAKLQKTTASVIASVGAPIVIASASASDYNASTGEAETNTKKLTGSAVRFDYDLSQVDGELIRGTDARLVSTVQAKPGDVVVFAGERLRAIDCKPLSPAGVSLYFEIQVRR